MFYIYLITNLVNGKMYVGQTELTVEQRFREHIYCKMKRDYFHAAIRKYTKDAFVAEEIGRCETQEAANEAEIFWIDKYNTTNRTLGYNTTHGGRYGSKPNEATRAKIGAYSKTRVHDEETREKMRQSHLDKEVPENQTGFRGVSLPLRQCRTFRARSKANGREVCFGFHREAEKANNLREEGIKILRSLSKEEISDLFRENSSSPLKNISASRWREWKTSWMDAQTKEAANV